MSSSACRNEDPMMGEKKTPETEIIVPESDFIIGSCSSTFDSRPTSQREKPLCALPTSTTTTDGAAYADCVRLLTRQLRQSPKLKGNFQRNDDTNTARLTKSMDDDWNEQFVNASQGIPELLALQNTIVQLQHAFNLIQQEAHTAIHDTAVALQSSQHWKREYHAVKQSAIALEQDNKLLKHQNELLIADKRKLKAACKKLLMQQHAVQSQQVESYVVSALVTHEQFLHGTSTCTGKNRSRTTTLDTTGTTAGDEFTVLDDPFTNSPDTTFESSDGRSSPKASMEVGDCNTKVSTERLSTPPTIAAMKEHNQQNQQSRDRGNNGFGNACHAFGRTFKFIDNHVHKREQRPVSENNVEHKCIMTDDDGVVATGDATVSTTYSPLPHDRPYNPIRFDVITPTRSEDSNDSVRAHRRKMHSSQSPSVNKPLIDVNTLLDGPIDNSNDHIERNVHKPSSDQILLSLPILPHSYGNAGTSIASSLKSMSPISIPEEEDEEETSYSNNHPSALRIQCQRYSCDPALLRSLSIPTIPVHSQPPPSASPDLRARTLQNT